MPVVLVRQGYRTTEIWGKALVQADSGPIQLAAPITAGRVLNVCPPPLAHLLTRGLDGLGQGYGGGGPGCSLRDTHTELDPQGYLAGMKLESLGYRPCPVLGGTLGRAGPWLTDPGDEMLLRH